MMVRARAAMWVLACLGPCVLQAQDGQASLEESYAYPGADAIFAETGVRLIAGDGHALRAPCVAGSTRQVKVEFYELKQEMCFDLLGERWSLTLAADNVCSVRAGSGALAGVYEVEGQSVNLTVAAERYAPLGMCDTKRNAPARIVQLWSAR